MKANLRLALNIFWIVLGVTLVALSLFELIDSFWSGMGSGLLIVGILQLVGKIRYRTDAEYREKTDTAEQDERNRFLRMKAWSWAGYLFILIAALATIVLRVLHYEQASLFASYGICLMLVLYCVSYWVCSRKY